MNNSPLVNYTAISPNKTSPRNHMIDTITIHHMAGDLTVERCGQVFANPARKASSNYGIGSDGRIGLYCEEKNRSWCSSSRINDNRAVTIEVANCGGAPDWQVSDAALSSLIELVADICSRNGIPELVWSDRKDDRVNHRNGCNMTIHRDFSATLCPGPYLLAKMPYIADKVNEKLGEKKEPAEQPLQPAVIHTVGVGDTLIRLGRRYGVDWHEIANLNGIKPPYIIRIGQKLRIK